MSLDCICNKSNIITLSISSTLLAAAGHAGAASVGNAAGVNNRGVGGVEETSSATLAGDLSRYFRSQFAAAPLAAGSGNTYFVNSQFVYVASTRGTAGPSVNRTNNNAIDYGLSFDIDDPSNVGYTITVDVRYSVARTVQSVATNAVANATTITGYIDRDTTDATNTLSGVGNFVGDLTTVGGSTAALPANALNNGYTEATQTFVTAAAGSRSVGLRFSNQYSPAVSANLPNSAVGEVTVRAGLQPVTPTPTGSGTPPFNFLTPGPDTRTTNDLGHFVTVTVEFNAIPAPGAAFAGTPLLALLATRRRR